MNKRILIRRVANGIMYVSAILAVLLVVTTLSWEYILVWGMTSIILLVGYYKIINR